MVTEWGSVNADGDGSVDKKETKRWIDWMKKNNITHLNWALNDKQEGSSVLKKGASTTGNWNEHDLTHSGRFVKKIIKDYNDKSQSEANKLKTSTQGTD